MEIRHRAADPARTVPGRREPKVDRTARGSSPGVGGFMEMSIDTFREMFRRPFQFREFLDQTWMTRGCR